MLTSQIYCNKIYMKPHCKLQSTVKKKGKVLLYKKVIKNIFLHKCTVLFKLMARESLFLL